MPPPAQPVPILAYHTISDEPQPGIAPFAVRPDDLARHLDLIVAGGHTPLSVSAYADLLELHIEPPPGTVVITFDDGFEDNLTVAAPLLAARRMPATVYVTTGFLPGCPGGTVSRVPGPMLDWRSLADLEAAGIEVGSHTHTHPQLDLLAPSGASREIRQSKDLLEAALGHPVHSFAYPHGYSCRSVREEVRRCGFRSACGVRNLFSHAEDNRWFLARFTVMATTTCDEVGQWLRGSGGSVATARERVRTTSWRMVRRATALPAAVTARTSSDPGRRDRT